MSNGHVTTNLEAAEDLAPKFGMGDMGEARFVRDALGAERIGLSHYRMNPGRRVGFGHRHGESEEVYVVLSGSGRFKVEDDVFPVGPKDVVYVPPTSMREWEAGPDGLELLAFGGHAEADAEMQPGWWTD
jgi:quercetin dioxygenase-like cupin family protein